ncbi:MAG: hypothetical protein LBT51_00485 [Fusobacteriaceae bacterium]|jgi:cytochrome c oxidase assembly factor CtaG|nr:hypothetical protein [Fusobacteriaceae bacterium]
MKILTIILFILSVWMIPNILHIDRKEGKKGNIITIIIFLVGCLFLYISLRNMGIIKF